MRAPLCTDSTDLCPDDQGLIGSESESQGDIQALEKSLEKSHSSKTVLFGVCLDNLMGTTPQVAPQIPFILSRLCRYIEEHGLHRKRLFLESDEKALVETLKVGFMESGDVPLEAGDNVSSVAKLIIIFFEELPEPLIPISAQPDFIKDMEKLSLNSGNCIRHLKQTVDKLPDSTYLVLKYLSRFLFKVTCHKEYNGMSSDNLAVIFAPLLFRPSSDDPMLQLSTKNVVNYFVQDYHSIFGDDMKTLLQEETVDAKPHAGKLDEKLRRQLPCPSSVVPLLSLSPLSVVIPSTASSVHDTDSSKVLENVPVLLIEGQIDILNTSDQSLANEVTISKGSMVTRKRKERRLSGEDSQQRSSSEERPPPSALVSLEKIELMRRCSSHEEVVKGLNSDIKKLNVFFPKEGLIKDESLESGSYVSGSPELIANEKNHSPHPPNAKRRELETRPPNLVFMEFPWMKTSHLQIPTDKTNLIVDSELSQYGSMQNSIAEIYVKNPMDCDASEAVSDDEYESSSKTVSDESEFLDSKISRIPRSASCPMPKGDCEENSESESSSLSLSWNMLFENTEPVRSDHHLSWPLSKDAQEDDTLLSPSVQHLRNSNFYEAPLSPSAYRSYLSYRSTHLDPSVPPSPPVEQEDFAKNLVESSTMSDSIKRLAKKIHGIKKRIRKFDEKFEAEFGYKPSHAEKANNPESKKLMSDLCKARKDLKALREESHLEHVSAATIWPYSRSTHILEDTTNQFPPETGKEKAKPSVEDSVGTTMKSLADDRKTAHRPDLVEDMTTDQVKDEKVAIQKALLHFESLHGKPSAKNDRNNIRPLYDRYRSVKRLLTRAGSFPGAVSKNKELCSELQPILEHVAMNFSPRQQRTEQEIHTEQKAETGNVLSDTEGEETSENHDVKEDLKDTSSSPFVATTYDNSNIHELPLSEMIFQLQQVKSEKRHLRKILREFEMEFYRLNGRKVQKEDKVPVDNIYGEYKHVKARLRLLEALVSKHDQHRLM